LDRLESFREIGVMVPSDPRVVVATEGRRPFAALEDAKEATEPLRLELPGEEVPTLR
jgi:hypothetical protein